MEANVVMEAVHLNGDKAYSVNVGTDEADTINNV